jgi:predicted transcriptional regulator
MDWKNPLRSIAKTVDADVLKVLVETYEPVTGNQLAHLAGRSYAQVSAVVGRLVREGMVLNEQHGRTYSYRLNREHVLALGLFDILSAPSRIEDQIWDSVEEWDPPPETVALFGPVARREAAPDSDVDVLVVRPDVVRHDDLA